MWGSDWPWLSSRTRCRPRFCSGLTSQRLLVSVRSKTSQPSSTAHTSRWSSSKSSTSLRRGQNVIEFKVISRLKAFSVEYLGGVYLAAEWNIQTFSWMHHQRLSTVHKMKTQVWQNATVIKCPLWFVTHLLFLSFCKLIFIPEINGKQWLSGVYENNLKACGMLRKMAGCHANYIKLVLSGLKNAKLHVWSCNSYSTVRKC